MDFLDNYFFGPFNYFERLFGFVNRFLKPSKGGRFGPTTRIEVRRLDKGGKHSFQQVINHLRLYGIDTFDHAYDATNHYFRVRNTQIRYARWLFNGGNFNYPRRAWKERG